MKTLVAIAALSLASIAAAQGPAPNQTPSATVGTASLTVRFEQVVAPSGQIMMSLFDNETAHDAGGKPVRVAMVKVEGSSATVTFTGLAPGRYAIKTFHDVDGDGQMKTNPFGMPLEPFAFSNGAKPQGGPAMWQAASFDVPSGASETRISFQ